VSRVIRKSQTHSSGEAYALIAALMATELLQPSRCLWLISPWISDLILLDNSAETYDGLRRWGPRPIRLSEILATLLSSSATVVIGTTPDPHNRQFLDRLSSLAQDARRDRQLSVFVDERNELHTKSIVADDFALVGSMNLTFNGVHLREEYLELRTDQEFVSQARIDAFESFGGIL
jgi:phosphatidylserine/phosphatidylglycerophosphate/cardiolipin synthase-like enzyme